MPTTGALPDDLRVLVNNAGVDSDYLPVEHSNLDDWRHVFETNVFGVVATTIAAIPVLRANRPAVVCNISSSSILASVPVLLRLPCHQGRRLGLRRLPAGRAGALGHPGGGDPSWPRRHRHVPAEHGGAGRRPASTATGPWPSGPPGSAAETADPMVATPASAAALIVDAILDDNGPMRYGCDPLSIGLLDLWRQSDDEAMFELTGRSMSDGPGPPAP